VLRFQSIFIYYY